MARALRSGGTIGLTSWAIGPSDNELGTAWTEIAANCVSGDKLREATRRALPNEEYLRSRDALSAVLRQAGLAIVHLEKVHFITNMTTAD